MHAVRCAKDVCDHGVNGNGQETLIIFICFYLGHTFWHPNHICTSWKLGFMANISDFSFQFSDVASLTWIPRGIFSIKWWQFFRACLNNFLKLVLKCYQTKKYWVQIWWKKFNFLEIWEKFKEITGILQHNILFLILISSFWLNFALKKTLANVGANIPNFCKKYFCAIIGSTILPIIVMVLDWTSLPGWMATG